MILKDLMLTRANILLLILKTVEYIIVLRDSFNFD